ADQRGDVAGAHFLDLVTLVGVHLHHTADALLLALDGVQHGVAGAQDARVHAGEGQGADDGVGGDLGRRSGGRGGGGGDTLVGVRRIVRGGALARRSVGRRRQVVDHGVANQGHALVREGGAADCRNEFTGDGAHAQTSLDVLDGQVAL